MAYSGAPYNFIPFSKDVYSYKADELVTHDKIDKGLTGEITYEITAKTAIMVDDGEGNFCKNAEGKEAIPGSTMRGLIRNNVQILGLCNFKNEDIDDYLLMYREVGSSKDNPDKARYDMLLGADILKISQGDKQKQISVLKNVKAGYVKNERGTYYIYQTKVDKIKKELGEMNYYVLSERKIIGDYLRRENKTAPFDYDFFINPSTKNFMQHKVVRFKKENRDGRIHYVGVKNELTQEGKKPKGLYYPYAKPVSYEIKNEKDVIKVKDVGQCAKKGYAVSTGKMNEKKAIYIIPEIDLSKDKIEISKEDVKAFQIDLNKRKNTLKQFGGKEWFDLPEEGKTKPIFYIQLEGRLYFGFTPRLRLFYDYGIKEGIRGNHKEGILDFAGAMFGYSRGNESFRSKVSFGDAVVQGEAKRLPPRNLVQGEPKASSYMDYLQQRPNDIKTYNYQDFRLRGVKQYWLQQQESQPQQAANNFQDKFKGFSPLAKETRFIGKVRFQNLTEAELGLLLWSLRLNEDSQMNVGKAKAYGYGRIELKIKEVKAVNPQKAYAAEGKLDLNPFELIDVDKMIQSYKNTVNGILNGRKIDELPHIKNFFAMKNAKTMPARERIKYMELRDYRNRKIPLPTVSEVLNDSNNR